MSGLMLFMALLISPVLLAQTTWTGATSNDWNTASNWTAGVPDAADDVEIPDVATNDPVIRAGTAAVAGAVIVEAGGMLTIQANASLTKVNESLLANEGGMISNAGLIVLSGPSLSGGESILNNGKFRNEAGGEIRIDRSYALFPGGFREYIYPINNLSNGSFENAGLIVIGSFDLVGTALFNSGRFTNLPGGEIRIDRTISDAIRTFTEFENSGKIIIGGSADFNGGGIYNAGLFRNQLGGEIRVDRATREGILNDVDFSINDNPGFENSGLIVVGGSAAIGGDGIFNKGKFSNPAGGIIRIDRANGSGVLNFQGSDGVADFENAGLIEIGLTEPPTRDGLNNIQTFSNLACGRIRLASTLINSGTFTNAGFLSVDTNQPHTNSGTLTNDGAIGYPQGNPIPNVTNNDLISPPVSVCGNGSVSPALDLGGANSFMASATWYKDPALTMPAGTYVQASNTFTASNLAEGTYPLYYRATDSDNACSDTLGIQMTVIASPTVNAGADQSVIFGFQDGGNCTDLTATASGGSGAGYTFNWNPGGLTGQTVTVCPTATTTYTVTATDANGCVSAPDEVTVNVQDVRCGNRNQNVTICYYGVTQCVSQKIAARYLKLGATLGGCGSSARMSYETETMPLKLSLKAYPNPVQDAVTVEVLSPTAGRGTFEVLDMSGVARQTRTKYLQKGLNEVVFRLGSLPTGIYLIKAVDALGQQATVRVSKE